MLLRCLAGIADSTDAAVDADADAKKLSGLTAGHEQNGAVTRMRIAAIDA